MKRTRPGFAFDFKSMDERRAGHFPIVHIISRNGVIMISIIYKSLSDISPYEENPRNNSAAVDAVAASISEFGFKVPLIINADNVIVCGHTRYMAAQKLNMETVPCIQADDLTPEQVTAFRLADNKTAELSEWNPDLLIAELSKIEDIDMSLFGFDAAAAEVEDGDIVEDDLPDHVDPVTKPGDIWEMKNHRLICGDCTDPETLRRLMGKEPAGMVFTDPPYGYSYQSNMRTKSEKFDVIQNDDKILDFFPAIKERCNGFIWICGTWKTSVEWMTLFRKYFDLTNVIIWDKGGGGVGDLYKTFATDYEMLFVSNQGKEIRGRRFGSVWEFTADELKKKKKDELIALIEREKEFSSVWHEGKDNPNEYMHPTQKPVRLSARAIRSSVDFDEIVLDVFAGSGSTLLACEQVGRRFRGVEIDPHFCDVIVQRWENYTGEKAVRIDG